MRGRCRRTIYSMLYTFHLSVTCISIPGRAGRGEDSRDGGDDAGETCDSRGGILVLGGWRMGRGGEGGEGAEVVRYLRLHSVERLVLYFSWLEGEWGGKGKGGGARGGGYGTLDCSARSKGVGMIGCVWMLGWRSLVFDSLMRIASR